MAFSFNRQLRSGSIGESLFYMAHEGTLSKEDGRARDFSLGCGEGLELKTDLYNMDKTPYFFMERWSDLYKFKPGGPWQSMANGTKYYAYFFVSNLTYYMFETEKLVAALEPILSTCEERLIENKSWTTVGYKVPRAALEAVSREVKMTLSVSVTP